ncbi:hypothetical protein VCR8J2_240082 [Vibrio coralliirubri]|nr:hypothetical protein VCR8J2_240082 [Vibrio coralliirubri]
MLFSTLFKVLSVAKERVGIKVIVSRAFFIMLTYAIDLDYNISPCGAVCKHSI